MGVKVLKVSSDFIMAMISEGDHHYRCRESLPNDAKIVSIFINRLESGEIDVVIGSSEFKETDLRLAPVLDLKFEKIEESSEGKAFRSRGK
jgi:hypothetical protein